MAATLRNAVTGAANFSVRCVSRDRARPGFGAAGNAEAMAIGERFAKADGHGSTKQRTIDVRQNDGKTQKGRKPSGEESSVTQNPLAALLKQKTYRCEKASLALSPLPGLFRPGKRAFAKPGAQEIERWQPLHNWG